MPSISWVSNSKWRQIIGRASGSMCSTTSPFWKIRTVPDDWLTATAMALVLLADGGGGPVARAQPLAERDALGRGVDVHARGHGDAVAADDDGPFELGDVLDLLAHAAGRGCRALPGCSRGTG